MKAFFMRFPEVATRETRSIFVFNHEQLPEDEYALLEHYCDELDCDCRRVLLKIVASRNPGKPLATINYGWERISFYKKWMNSRFFDPEEFKGPYLDPLHPQSRYAPALLKLFEQAILTDKKFISRLKRHYQMFKQSVDDFAQPVLRTKRSKGSRIGRNVPCTCGSGKKYKRCCGAKQLVSA